MALDNFLGRILKKEKPNLEKKKMMILQDQLKIYTDSVGRDVYYSDIVKSIIHLVCDETSKLRIRCIKETFNPHKVETVNNTITKLFRYKPNQLTITRDFLYKLRYLLLETGNAWIYPRYIDKERKVYKEFLLVNPVRVEFSVDENNDDELYVELTLEDGSTYPLNYTKDIIHLRHSFGEDNYMGGTFGGSSDNEDLSKTIQALNDITQTMPAALKNSLKIRGILTPKALADAKTLSTQRDEFEKRITESQMGIAVTDLSADFTPINVNPAMIDGEILKWLEGRVSRNYGVSLAMLSGDYSDQQRIAFHQRIIESFKDTLEQSLTASLVSEADQNAGLAVKVYDNFIGNLSVETRIKIIDSTSALPIFSVDEYREMLGQEPVGDDRRFNSLNNMDANKVTDYQMAKVQQKLNGAKNKPKGESEEDE